MNRKTHYFIGAVYILYTVRVFSVLAVNVLTGFGFFLTSGFTIHASILPVETIQRDTVVKFDQFTSIIALNKKTTSTVLHRTSSSKKKSIYFTVHTNRTEKKLSPKI